MRIVKVGHVCPHARCAWCGDVFGDGPSCAQCHATSPDRADLGTEVLCGSCERSWCEACQPAPAAMCVWCNGAGVNEAARLSVDLDDPEDVAAYLGRSA